MMNGRRYGGAQDEAWDMKLAVPQSWLSFESGRRCGSGIGRSGADDDLEQPGRVTLDPGGRKP
jgi:hypothetical protein